jgi:hypothetical protein
LARRFPGRFVADDGELDEEEEKDAMLARFARRGADDTEDEDFVGSEISEFRNAAEVVGEMVAAEEGRSALVCVSQRSLPRMSMESHATSLPDYMSQVGGESLPTYEDDVVSDGVVDGLLYTPGSTEYTPSHGSGGTLDSVLGDRKD